MTIIVCGGRAFDDEAELYAALDTLHEYVPITRVVTGDARGADQIGNQWARARQVQLATWKANWKMLGSAAGPIRNGQMLDGEKPRVVVACPGGRGTMDMVTRAQKAGVPVWRLTRRRWDLARLVERDLRALARDGRLE